MTDKPRFQGFTLMPDEKPRKQYLYFATGRGGFPFDMLRFDCAWPASSRDAALMDPEHQGLRSIQLLSHKEPTIARWDSFLWSIGAEEI